MSKTRFRLVLTSAAIGAAVLVACRGGGDVAQDTPASTHAHQPVAKPAPAPGSIAGFVSTALLGPSVQVSAQQDGVIAATATPNRDTGEFLLPRLAPGHYEVVITAADSAASVVAAVPVAASHSTILSTASAPIMLAPGNTGSIGGRVNLHPAIGKGATVAARQRLADGPTITVKVQGAEPASGAYTLASLPVAPPQLATYGKRLPLVFSASSAATPGRYTVEAAATGYAPKTVDKVDIAMANRSRLNFALVP
ncbi:carboxypeptidase-like regulatory domain-containing protein [Massilia sp. ST3]|uniref:carboxypeptidase-like regulatory domain-containing protein n=1 Tax=Massilia sp. ST3 TaxID=2824903 RepID=UPI001B840CAD|nr:carboxypeptidase-like regulatory domain-containing protein [Massilia sp. ST3]MBQ5948014.1 carboxypeptidase regulatory-like domain-containing protein [Massilia sp. ST3]